jgi:hypothetical protein
MSMDGDYTNVGLAVVAESRYHHRGRPIGDHRELLQRRHDARATISTGFWWERSGVI